MEINTHYFESLSLKEVKELLPPNHSIKQVDTQGLQEAGCYFVAILNFYAGKRRRKNISIVRLVLLPVLEDGSQDAKKVECFLCDRYCNELENEMTTMLGSQGTWSADMAGDDVVWVVLHRPFIVPSYRKTSNDFNQLCIIASDKKSPYCQMWLLFTIPCVKVPPSLSHINLMRSNPAVSAKLSVQAQAKYPIKGQACVPPYVPANSKHKIKPLSQAVPRQKISTAGAVISVVKMGYVAKNSVIYDIIKVADGVTGPTSNPTIIFIKIFHNNSIDWPKGGIPRRGHVIVLLDMLCQNYEGRKEGVISTEKVCVFKYKEEHLTCYSNSPGCPHNIENAEEVAVRLFDWFRQHGFLLSSFTEADLPTRKIVDLSGSGLFIINCQVVKKNIYPALVSPMVVLRVRDGTRSPYKFEKINYNPTKIVSNQKLVMGDCGSLEVDVLVTTNVIPPELDELEVGSFVQLRGVDCCPINHNDQPNDNRILIFRIQNQDGFIKILSDDDPQLLHLKNSVLEATEQEKHGSSGQL